MKDIREVADNIAQILEAKGEAKRMVEFLNKNPDCIFTMAAFIVHAVDFEIKGTEDLFAVDSHRGPTNSFDSSKITDDEIEKCVAAIDDRGRDNLERFLIYGLKVGAGGDKNFDKVLAFYGKRECRLHELGKRVESEVDTALIEEAQDKARAAYNPATDIGRSPGDKSAVFDGGADRC